MFTLGKINTFRLLANTHITTQSTHSLRSLGRYVHKEVKVKYLIVIILIASSLVGLTLTSKKMYWELDLQTGVAKAEYSHLGLVTSSVSNFHNPKSCPTWTPPPLAKSQNSVSYSCYFHFKTESCSRKLLIYQQAYNEGCGT